MTVLNDLDRFDLVIDVIDRTRAAGPRAGEVRKSMQDALQRHARYINEHGEDMPEIREWRWPV
jgi:xylulose-5-phosphate/fructose-6-phosphate phosphoketolase